MKIECMEVIPVSEYWGELLKSGGRSYAGLLFRIPPRLWRPLIKAQEEFRRIDKRQLYSQPANFHVSVKGLGTLDGEKDLEKFELSLSRIRKIVSSIEPFQVKLRGIDIFPTCIYAKVEDQKNSFKNINKRISDELRGQIDSSVYDGDAYIPHVTLLTFNTRDASRLIEKSESKEMREMDIGEAGVFEIELVNTDILLAFGPEETQDKTYSYLRSFHLGSVRAY
jgi:2'-5' RNA ligase